MLLRFARLVCYMENIDKAIVKAILRRDSDVTKDFLYVRCYPLFKAVFDNYHTDCSSCMEFINEIYIHVMTPDRHDGLCKLQKFRFESSLFTWLKTVCVFYCYKKYKKKSMMETERISEFFEDGGVRIDDISESITIEDALARDDVETILNLMPNRRYSMLIRLKYLEEHSNEDTAAMLGMNMNTFYNKHKLAKEQFVKTLNMEESYNGEF